MAFSARIFILALIALSAFTHTRAQLQTPDTTAVFADTLSAPPGSLSTNPDSTRALSAVVAKDTAAAVKDTVKKPFEPNPKKAGLYSAIIPGLGQIYTGKYWKLPVIYAGLGVGAYFIKYNSDNYRMYRSAYISRIDADQNNDELVGLYRNAEDLKQLQDESKKYLDITILLSCVAYTVQVIDAIVFAHLKNFDVSRNISLRLAPVVAPNYAGIGFAMTFK